jgi:hypothetical protein
MILKPPQGCSIHPLRFARPSAVNDTPQAWAKLERDYVKFLRELREAVWCFGAARVEQDVHRIIKGRQGRTPDQKLNALLFKEHDLRKAKGQVKNKGKVNLTELVREVRKKHHLRTVKEDSLRTQVRRLLKTREREIREKAEHERKLRRRSLVGSGTK